MEHLSDSNLEPSSAQARILVVDDNEDNRYMLIMRLQLEGYKNITAADDGESALELLRTQDFDLVLLDVMMPKIDGYQVLQRLRAAGQLHDIPVIMVSALNEDRQCRALHRAWRSRLSSKAVRPDFTEGTCGSKPRKEAIER